MNTTELNIPAGDNELHAKLHIPVSGKIRHLAIFAHCFTCTKNLGIARHISKTLTEKGIAVLRFDFAGLGKSDGEFSDTNFTHNIKDIKFVYDYLAQKYKKPELLIGHSLGGAAVLAATADLPDVKAIVTIGSPSTPSHVKHMFEHQIEQIKEKGVAEVNVGGRPFQLKKQFLEDIENRDLTNIIHNLKKPLLILHSPQDTIVEIENAAEIYQAAFHPKSFISLDGADHILSNKEDAIYAADVIASWAQRYVPFEELQTEVTLEEKEILIHLNLNDGFTSSIFSNEHSLIADEPKSAGGKDMGFAPYDLLNASLGACTVMTLKLYAERKEWDLKEVFVRISNEKKEEIVNGKRVKKDYFKKKLKFVGNLSEEQKAKLLDISSRCPVHRTIAGEVTIDSIEVHD